MEGRCAECGLEFEWWRIHSHVTHPWLFEYHWRKRPIRSLVRTIATMCRPRRFWSSIDLTDPVHLGWVFLLAFMAVAAPVFLRLVASGACLFALEHYRASNPSYGSYSTPTRLVREALSTSFWVQDSKYFYSSDISWLISLPQVALWWFALVWIPLTALCFRLIPVSLHRLRVRPAHIRRIAGYGVAWMMLLPVALAAIEIIASVANGASIWFFGKELYWGSLWGFPMTIGPLPTLPLLFAPLAYWWWASACRYYLKLPDSRLVAALLTLLSGLITFGGFVFLAESLGEHGWWMALR